MTDEALFRIIVNDGDRCDGKIINIGNPDNEASIQELATLLFYRVLIKHPLRCSLPPFAGFCVVAVPCSYGSGYQDAHRETQSNLLTMPRRLGRGTVYCDV
ncbi:hypothetical protein KCP70_02600 [Salmonella enterica subsp. enterica]|nr:hypothetical protein KCP70_02600 [Salmonella enterica subsp. enterica]